MQLVVSPSALSLLDDGRRFGRRFGRLGRLVIRCGTGGCGATPLGLEVVSLPRVGGELIDLTGGCGANVGSATIVGDGVGLNVGDRVGFIVGIRVGLVGLFVGLRVGIAVGDGVGFLVGVFVGESVGQYGLRFCVNMLQVTRQNL